MKIVKQTIIVVLTIVFSFFISIGFAQSYGTNANELPVYQNPIFSIDQRVEDLLSRMTLEEKLGQLNMPYPGEMSKDLPGKIDACRFWHPLHACSIHHINFLCITIVFPGIDPVVGIT